MKLGRRARLQFFGAVLAACVVACLGDDPTPATVTESDGGSDGAVGPSSNEASTSKAIGELCSTGGECASGFCADGVCCDRACNGQCEACSLGTSKGTCTPVTGTPITPRPACTGAGTCEGTCDGKSSSCTYASAGTICGGSCSGKCDGAGTCSDGTGSCPNGFNCGGAGTCLTTCVGPTDCQPNFSCDGATKKCKRNPESDCLDGQDNNGDGLADCADPTCIDLSVSCVPSVGAGATIGTVVPTLPCPTDFGSPVSIYQGVNSGSCAGCSCKTSCNGTVTFFAGANCTGGASASESYFTGYNGDSTACKNDTDFNAASMQVTSLTRGSCLGSGTAAWSPSTPVWGTSKVFCGVARTSATCGQNKVCVPKTATPLTAKVASTGACPTGYATPATYYTGYSNGSCPACSACTPSATVSCGIIGFGHRSPGDNTCSAVSDFVGGNTNGTMACSNFGATDTIYSTHASWLIGTISGDTCTNNTTPIAPTPTGGQLICNVQ